MRADPGVGWSTYADQPLDPAQRDALVQAQVRPDIEGSGSWRLPDGWGRAWVTFTPPGGAYGSGAVQKVRADGVGDWFAPAPGWARPASGRRPPRGSGLALAIGDQTALWRRGYPLAVRNDDEDADRLAARHGPVFAEVPDLPNPAVLLDWRTMRLPGWSAGGPLHLDCPRHGKALQHWRCDHSSAISAKRRFLAMCRDCDADEAARLSKRLRRLLSARAALDAELATPGRSETPHHVYVVEAAHPTRGVELYVGQTGGDVEARIAQHRAGGTTAARVFRKGAAVGATRTDLVPEEWTLPTRPAALAAEAFTHVLLAARDPGVRVHGDLTQVG
jgi:predicted GIY-YIG superfamily endonuclease